MNDSTHGLKQSTWCGTIPSPEALARAKKIELILWDVDGVLTDGRVYFVPQPDGQLFETKGFDSHDGLAFHMLTQAGIKTGLISGRKSPAVEERAKNMNAVFLYQGFLDKEPIFEEIIAQSTLKEEQIAFIGDDFTDIPLLKRAGLACVVANAREETKRFAHFITQAKGGEGAAREIVELLLKAQNKWDQVLKKYGIV